MGKHHKMYNTPTYNSWREMKYRCGKRLGYENINYSPSWGDFRIFFKDMGIRPEKTTLDRIDGTKGYFKENCRWATNREQAINRTSTHFFEYSGLKLILRDWADMLGIKRSTLAQRIYVYRWPLAKALRGQIFNQKRKYII